MIRSRPVAAAALLAALLGGCTVGPDYQAPKPDLPARFVAIRPTDAPAKASAADETRWWESFQDPELTSLVERAIAGNLDLKRALARLQEARTNEAVVVGTSLPEIGVSGA